MLNKEKNIPSGLNARHCLGQNAHARGRLTPQFFSWNLVTNWRLLWQWILQIQYKSDMEMQPIFLQTSIESLANINDMIPGI